MPSQARPDVPVPPGATRSVRALVAGVRHPLAATRAGHADVLDPEHGRVGEPQRRPGRPHQDGRDADRQQVDAGAASRRGGAKHPAGRQPDRAADAERSGEHSALAVEGRADDDGAAPPQAAAILVGGPHRVIRVRDGRAVEVLQHGRIAIGRRRGPANWPGSRQPGRIPAHQDARQAAQIRGGHSQEAEDEGQDRTDRQRERQVGHVEQQRPDEQQQVHEWHRFAVPSRSLRGRAGPAQ